MLSVVQLEADLVLRLPRDIYYIDPAYFRSQDTVDTVIDELAYTIGVDRGALNVVSLRHEARGRTKRALAEHTCTLTGSRRKRLDSRVLFLET